MSASGSTGSWVEAFAVIAVILSGASPSAAGVIFADDFESGSLSAWSTPYGSWDIVDEGGSHGNVLRGTGWITNPPWNHSGITYVTEGQTWMDYCFEYDVKGTDPYDQQAVFRVLEGADDYYIFSMLPYHPITPSNLANNMGTWNHDSPDYPWLSDVWHHVRICIEGPHITVDVDGANIFDVWDGPIMHAGSVGFVIWPNMDGSGGRTLYYDNVLVTPEPATLALLALGGLLAARRRR